MPLTDDAQISDRLVFTLSVLCHAGVGSGVLWTHVVQDELKHLLALIGDTHPFVQLQLLAVFEAANEREAINDRTSIPCKTYF